MSHNEAFRVIMSIVIDGEDDDLLIVDNSVKSVYADDTELVKYIETDLESNKHIISDCYRDIYRYVY